MSVTAPSEAGYTFKPRTEAPAKNATWYISSYKNSDTNVFSNGKSTCDPANKTSVESYKLFLNSTIPSNFGYAWGRFSEILEEPCSLSESDPGGKGIYYSAYLDKYKRGSEPKIGSVAVWRNTKTRHDFLGIVESITNDTITISYSQDSLKYPSPKQAVQFKKIAKPYTLTSPSGYTFIGFIYNPRTANLKDKLQQFIELAQLHGSKQENYSWTISHAPGAWLDHWCAMFVVACAATVGGIDGVIIPHQFTADMGNAGSRSPYNGTWLPGPHQGNYSNRPQPGDLIMFIWSWRATSSTYSADHVGIVIDVNDKQVITAEGNTGQNCPTGSRTKIGTYSLDYVCITGYFRPDWARVGASASSVTSEQASVGLGELYEDTNTREDATVREVGYITADGEPSIKSTRIRLSVANYTKLINAEYQIARDNLSVSPSITTSISTECSQDAKSVVQYLVSKGLTAAIAVGIAGNIKHESNFNPGAVGDGGTSFGICQWHDEAGSFYNGQNMKDFVGTDWKTNLSGQLDYVYYQITTGFKSMFSRMQAQPNNEAGARACADLFVRNFERPANVDYQSTIRQNSASEIWKQVALILT